MSNEHKHKWTNKLIKEKSPYLLQHAYNPVDWYPWSQEAFDKARQENKPIFLSIGYSTCHWCHVMRKESFEDAEVARVINKYFIAIKVDREERPDIDHIYMTACQMLTGSGGWPLTVFMTPDAKPFFVSTYFPKKDRMGMPGLITIMERINYAWENNREGLIRTADEIASILSGEDRSNMEMGVIDRGIDKKEEIDKNDDLSYKEITYAAYSNFKNSFDHMYGGFGSAPKFPSPHNLYFLLRYWYVTGEKFALEMVTKTLDAMYRGGIYDHIGFGFSRYSTDRKWLVPHFEKMLYDNALLAIAYIEAWHITKNTNYANTAIEIFTYVLRDMTSEEGGFYSAEDADSEGVEGKFYVWSPDEIKEVLEESDGEKFCRYYDITPKGNFEDKNIPNLINQSISDNSLNKYGTYAYINSKTDADDNSNININKEIYFIDSCRQKLFQYREKRIHPHKDDKILTSWNGLIIAAMAVGGRILEESNYIKAAERAAEFIFTNLIRDDGRLMARHRQGETAYPGYIDDYAFFIWGLIELYEATFKPFYLKKAIELSNAMMKLFWDNREDGFFMYGSDSEQLIARPKEAYDGATPSGNSVAALNFIRLAKLTGNQQFSEISFKIFKAFEKELENAPTGYAFMLSALMHLYHPSDEIVLVADNILDNVYDNECIKMIGIINKKYNPFMSVLLYSKENMELSDFVPYITDYKTIEGKTTAYLCRNFTCKPPVNDSNKLRATLESNQIKNIDIH